MPEALAPAKINLFLHVGPVAADGYHPVCSLMEKVSLFDRLALETSGEAGIRLTGKGIPAGTNTVETAARLLAEAAGRRAAADFVLYKEIPVAAGLAGGSSDAAAAIKLLLASGQLQVEDSQIAAMAAAVGSDVPFFLQPGPQLATGTGTVISPVDGLADYWAVIAMPEFSLSTAAVYGLYDEMCLPDAGDFQSRCRQAVEGLSSLTGVEALAAALHNDLETPAMHLCPAIKLLKQQMLEAGAAGALMSGSGPSVFGLFASEVAAIAARRQLGNGARTWIVQPVRGSIPAD